MTTLEELSILSSPEFRVALDRALTAALQERARANGNGNGRKQRWTLERVGILIGVLATVGTLMSVTFGLGIAGGRVVDEARLEQAVGVVRAEAAEHQKKSDETFVRKDVLETTLAPMKADIHEIKIDFKKVFGLPATSARRDGGRP